MKDRTILIATLVFEIIKFTLRKLGILKKEKDKEVTE